MPQSNRPDATHSSAETPQTNPTNPSVAGNNQVSLGRATFFSWRSVFAGGLIALLISALLAVLGLALGASSYNFGEIMQGEFTWSSGLWLVLSGVVALYSGSYITSRISNYTTRQIGALHGLVVAALFFIALSYQTGEGLSALGSGSMTAFNSLSRSLQTNDEPMRYIENLASRPEIRSAIEDSMAEAGLDMPENTQQFVTGFIARVIRGDSEQMANYLSQQLDISVEEAQAEFNTLTRNTINQLEGIADTTAQTVAAASWILFLTLLLGSGAGIMGGIHGSRTNRRHPLVEEKVDSFRLADRIA